MEKVNLAEKFSRFDELWSPRLAGDVNDHAVKLVKIRGEFVWHHHENEDELFFVVRGSMRLRFRDRDVILGENEFLVVPKGVEHMPVADEEAWILLFEPKETLNTGNLTNARTVASPKTI
ncbi:MAG TPA: cupin domain-containing protein [Thermoanaerobaculia bacterium]